MNEKGIWRNQQLQVVDWVWDVSEEWMKDDTWLSGIHNWMNSEAIY